MTLELTVYYSRMGDSDQQTRVTDLKKRIKSLQKQDLIDSYEILTSPNGIRRETDPTRTGQAQRWTRRFDNYQQWARQTGVGLSPEFQQRKLTNTRLEFPSLHLTARTDVGLKGVFPCVERDPVEETQQRYTINHYLDALEAGEDWRTHRPSNPRNLAYTDHDIIQAWLATAPDYFLTEWQHIETEYPLSSTRHDDARVDLVFKQADGTERYLLVEIKPERNKVDKAFGQLLRYRYAFAEHHTTPNLKPDDIELAIATPEIGEYHEQAAADLGITVIQEFDTEEP